MKVSELTGATLDYWVAKSLKLEPFYDSDGSIQARQLVHIPYHCHGMMTGIRYSPSTDWSQGGPIIEREKIIPRFVDFGYFKGDPFDKKWFCCYSNNGTSEIGDTLLTAAMRCFVASKFGDEVPK